MNERGRRARAAMVAIALQWPHNAWAEWPPWLAKDEPPPQYPEILITADSLADGDFVVLDARDADRWGRGHLPGAVSMSPVGMSEADVVARLASRGFSGRERFVCVGGRGDLVEVARLFWLLEAAGCPNVRILDGEMESAPGRSLSTSDTVLPPRRWLLGSDERRIADVDYVCKYFGRPDPGRPDVEILDARPEHLWSGVGDPDGGHIPHSLPVDVGAFVRADRRFAPAESIRAIVDRVGPRAATTVDLSKEFVTLDDGISSTGALAYVALRLAGVEHVRYFPGGWAEWKAHAMPRVRIAAAPEIRALLADAERGSREVVLVDVRGEADFAAGHIPSALPMSPVAFADSLGPTLARERPGLDPARATFVAYCYGAECVRSRNAATVAAQQGFLDSIWFRGGLPEWLALRGEVIRRE